MGRHINTAHAPLGTLLALIEGVMNGTTTFGDYNRPMNDLIRSHIQMGSRGVLCNGISALNWANREQWLAQGWQPGDPTPLDEETFQRTFEAEKRLHDEWDGYDDGRIKIIFGPHAADFLSREMLLAIQEEAQRRGALMHLHVAQDPRENNATLQRYGLRAIPFLDSLGLLGSDLIAVHLSTATDDEVELVARSGARMVCCSNSIGIIDGVMPPIALYKECGGIAGLGSDQAPGNNSHNVFSEMRATAMYAKIAAGSPLPMPAWSVLRSATIEGATALGIGDRAGSLEAGKEADLIMLDLTKPPLAPVLLEPARNLVPNLVYAETGRNVTLSMVAGKIIYRDDRFSNVDVDQVHRELVAASSELQEKTAQDELALSTPIVQLTREGRI
jgi:5-methylthioadenosine/S-adenosylhomocysteine deaminase